MGITEDDPLVRACVRAVVRARLQIAQFEAACSVWKIVEQLQQQNQRLAKNRNLVWMPPHHGTRLRLTCIAKCQISPPADFEMLDARLLPVLSSLC